MEVDDIAAIHRKMLADTAWYGPGGVTRHAMSGIDMALWDLRGKAAGQPVRRLLDAAAVNQVPCYASLLWPDSPEQVSDSARAFIDQGYRAVKYGWGPMGPDAELDAELVAAARQALGPEASLMVDAGRAWDADTALARIECFGPYGLDWLEEPLRPNDLSGYRRLAAAGQIPIAAGEAITLIEEYERLLEEGRIDIVQPDLGRVGGITQGERIAALARASGARTVPHAFGTGVLLAASAQWTAAGRQPLTEYTRAPSPLARQLVRHTMEFKDGSLRLTDAPGLGIELDETVVEQYRVR
jgi:L-alanine-DL-glutamate epimerase-like enolase superfamily enzyme